MQIHFDKTSCMPVRTRHRTRESPDLNIMIDNNKIKQVHNQNLLGKYTLDSTYRLPLCHNFLVDLPSKAIARILSFE